MSWFLSAKFDEQRTLIPVHSNIPDDDPEHVSPSESLRISPAEVECFSKHSATLELYTTRIKNGTSDASIQEFGDAVAFFRKLSGKISMLIPTTAQPTASSAVKAQDVFDTPELLEEILLYLDTKEKLSAMEVQRVWRNTILGSPGLKHALGLEIDEKAKLFDSPFFSVEDLYKYPKCPTLPCGRKISSLRDVDCRSLTIHFSKGDNDRASGTRINAMRLFSLPLTSLNARTICGRRCLHQSSGGDSSARPILELKFEDKHLTVGELATKTRHVLGPHSDCKHPPDFVHWEAHFTLRDDDPIWSAGEGTPP